MQTKQRLDSGEKVKPDKKIDRPKATFNETEPNDEPATANEMKIGDIVDGTIDPEGDVDYFTFTGSKDQPVFIDIEAWESGSRLDAVVTLYDSDGITELAKEDYGYGSVDPFFGYTLPHSGTYFIKIEDDGTPDGGPDYFYSLFLKEGGTIKGTVTLDNKDNLWDVDLYAYRLNGSILDVFSVHDLEDGQYSCLLPQGNLKIFASEYDTHGEWYDSAQHFQQADTVSVPAGGTVSNIDFELKNKLEIWLNVNYDNYSTGDTMEVDVHVQNYSVPTTAQVVLSLTYPDQGINDLYPIGNRLVLFTDKIQIGSYTDKTINNFFSYTFTGKEPPGEYWVRCEIIDVSTQYGQIYSFDDLSHSDYFEFEP